MTVDAKVRFTATDPSQSFIVQAPAGSGKTEILTQRFIRLLTTVEKPEQVVAITFTRKAAFEMRERVLTLLRRAEKNQKPASPHQRQTYQWAQETLAHDRLKNWQLLQNPNRLQIQTIDALCQHIAHSLPKLEQAVPYARVSDQPKQLYLNAAQNCFDHAREDRDYQAELKILLQHMDNQVDHLQSLFCDLLAKRDQWLNLIYLATSNIFLPFWSQSACLYL
jgi:ATP-dependent exoDNAse (exonuclease V) beta subunit